MFRLRTACLLRCFVSATLLCVVFILLHILGIVTIRKTGVNSVVCPETPPDLRGPIVPSMEAVPLEETAKVNPAIQLGGNYRPAECQVASRTAIIVPFRDRERHLKVWLANMLPLLQRQQLHFQLFLVTCPRGVQFNKAKLMNIAFREVSSMGPFDCFVFHDVDFLPEDDRNIYKCHPTLPRHLSVNIDKFNYKPYYEWLFGGITLYSKQLFQQLNGYSNFYWGWGGEDDDMSMRLAALNKSVIRYPDEIARYKMIKHEHDEKNPVNWCRKGLTKRAKLRFRQDGLSDLHYKLLSVQAFPLYTLITADLFEMESKILLREMYPFMRVCWREDMQSNVS